MSRLTRRGLRAVLECDDLVSARLAENLGADGCVRDQRLTDRRVVSVGDEQDAIKRDRVARLDVEELDLELGADLDAVLLPAGLDDCVHGSSGLGGGRTERPRRGQGMTLGRSEARTEVYGGARPWSILREGGRTGRIRVVGEDQPLADDRIGVQGVTRCLAERGEYLLGSSGTEPGWKRVRVRTTTGGPGSTPRSTIRGRRS